MPKMPSADYFKSQMPSVDSFKAQAESKIMDKVSSIPQVEELKAKAEEKIMGKLGNIDITNLPEPKSTGELASELGSKLGLKVDSEKIDTALGQIDAIKSSMTSKAIDRVKNVAEKVGIKVPDIPSEDEIAQMIISEDMAENIDGKIAAIESFINSKLG